jgi:cytochrome P450
MKFTASQIHNYSGNHNESRPDFLTKFLQMREKHPALMTDQRIATYANTNVSAGSDTTAIALREVLYRILSNPDCLDKVLAEIGMVVHKRMENAEDMKKPITWAESQGMLYFQAVTKECLRIHPGLGQRIPRDVPPEGITIC